MPSRRKRSPVTQLLKKRAALRVRTAKAADALAAAQAAHDPRAAHPSTWSFGNPWLPGCADCDRLQLLTKRRQGTPRFVAQEQLVVLHRLADATEHAHEQRLVGQRKTSTARRGMPSQTVSAVANYLRKYKLPPQQRGISKRVSTGLNLPLRTVQRALRAINKN